jgi:hypothetical protein
MEGSTIMKVLWLLSAMIALAVGSLAQKSTVASSNPPPEEAQNTTQAPPPPPSSVTQGTQGTPDPGTHELFITPDTFNEVQAVLAGHNRPKYSKREVALRGLMNCAYDGMLTGDVQKKKYVYYRCTGHRGKCVPSPLSRGRYHQPAT